MISHTYKKYLSIALAASLLMPMPAQAGIWDYARSAWNGTTSILKAIDKKIDTVVNPIFTAIDYPTETWNTARENTRNYLNKPITITCNNPTEDDPNATEEIALSMTRGDILDNSATIASALCFGSRCLGLQNSTFATSAALMAALRSAQGRFIPILAKTFASHLAVSYASTTLPGFYPCWLLYGNNTIANIGRLGVRILAQLIVCGLTAQATEKIGSKIFGKEPLSQKRIAELQAQQRRERIAQLIQKYQNIQNNRPADATPH